MRSSTRACIDTYTVRGEELDPGSHIVTPRRAFLHHGIYVGGGKVVHYAGLMNGLRRGPVEEVCLAEFARGRAVLLVAYAQALFDRHEVVRRARSRVGENSYRLLTNNCEHFCAWCLRGECRSHQVEALLSWPGRFVCDALEWATRAHARVDATVSAPRKSAFQR
jgi:hypothetical protein